MRSRLEAKFAALLDSSGDTWEYEPRAFANERGQYLPDFLVYGWGGRDFLTYIEVKPTPDDAYSAMARMQIIRDSEPSAGLVLVSWEPAIWWVNVPRQPWRIIELEP